MKKKVLSALMSVTMVAALLAGCGSSDSATTTTTDTSAATEEAAAEEEAPAADDAADAAAEEVAETVSGGGKVGVAMPTQSSERWINDGANMKDQLEKLGYEVDLQYAEDDIQMQVSQIENMIASGADCLVIASIDSSALVNVEAQAKEAGIPIIAYDRLLMDTDAVSYYATFDNKGVGTAIAKYVEEKLDLANATESYTIEFFMGSPDDNNAVFLYNGVMEVLPDLHTSVPLSRYG